MIIDLDYHLTEQAFIKLGVQDFNSHFNQLKQTTLFDDFDRGKISEGEFRNLLNQQLKTQFSDEQINGAWNAMLLGIEEKKFRILRKLYPDFKTYLLSNTNIIHLKWITQYLIRMYGRPSLDSLFDKVYYSFVVGQRKPDPEIFLKVIDDNNLKPAETLFIDDNPENIAAAKKLGLRAELFIPSQDLELFLEKHLHFSFSEEPLA